MEIDKKDILILEELQENARQSSRDLSKKLGIPATTIHERIKKLEKNKIIQGYHTAVDPEKVGIRTTAIVLARVRQESVGKKEVGLYKKIGETLSKLSDVQEVHVVTGDYDMVLKIRGRNEKEIGEYVANTIWTIPGIERTLTLISFSIPKDTCKLNFKYGTK